MKDNIMAKPVQRKEARRLRKQGKSVKEIAKMVGVSTSTVSRWTKDIVLTDEQIENLRQQQKQWGKQNKGAQKNKETARLQRAKFQHAGRLKAQEQDILHMQGCLLYWAEGTKDRNRLEFVNADNNMMSLYLQFLVKSLEVSISDIIVRIHCHETDIERIGEIQSYWSNLLGIPLSNFGKRR